VVEPASGEHDGTELVGGAAVVSGHAHEASQRSYDAPQPASSTGPA